MRLHIAIKALAAVAALSLAVPAAAVSVPIDYTFLVNEGGQQATFGSMTLDYDGSLYSLQSLDVTLPSKSAIVTSFVTLSPVTGTSDYCLYTLTTCTVVPEKNSLYLIFDPSLTSQTITLHGYSTKDLAEEDLSVTIQQDAAVPEPGTWALMLLGFASIGASMGWRRRGTMLFGAR